MPPNISPSSPDLALPIGLSLLRARLTYRLLEDARLPAYKGGMLRGGFGYAFQRSACPRPCWGHANNCEQPVICPYRWVFETPHPPDVAQLHDLQDVPRPFVIDLPNDQRTWLEAGDSLEFGVTLIGRGATFLPFFLFGFARLGETGLGSQRARATLERVVALEPWQPTGAPIYAARQVLAAASAPPLLTTDAVLAQAAALPEDLEIVLRTPLRVKTRGALMQQLDLPALVRAVCWRLDALATFHGDGPWARDYRPIVAAAAAVAVEHAQVQWVEWERRSDHHRRMQRMQLGGLVGRATLRGVPPAMRAVLLMGSFTHAGKACVFGHGDYRLQAAATAP